MFIISKESSLYPQKLLSINNPPDILFAIGNINLLNKFSLAIVGSRKYTYAGKLITESLVKDLVNKDIVIISGMANGIDSIAHEACIEAGGKTISILGSGFLDAKRKKIFRKILESDGLIISEYFPDLPAYKSNFPRRNELISAMSDGVIVTEAKINSGTLITAKHALLQSKPLFSFPANINEEAYEGNNYILTQGAKCIVSYEDILRHYPNFNLDITPQIKKIIPAQYKEIYNFLKKSPISINILSTKLDISISELQYKLMLMEMDGFIKKLPNGEFIKI